MAGIINASLADADRRREAGNLSPVPFRDYCWIGRKRVLHALWEKRKRIRVIFAGSACGRKGLPIFVKQSLGFSIERAKRPRGTKGFVLLPKR